MGTLGAYGTRIPIGISAGEINSMVDISFCYHANMTYDSFYNMTFKKLDSGLLTPCTRMMDAGDEDEVVEGMYNLQLPLSQFNKKGFYTVYIKPKEVSIPITDVGTLTAFPNIRGIILDSERFTVDDSITRQKLLEANGLVGYRVIFMDDDGQRQDYYRIVTSNNRCEPIVQAPNSSSDKSYTYRYDESSSLVFLTLTPSTAPSFKSNAEPYIGKPTQRILLVNTMFEPVVIDIEMTTHDADTISFMLENSQLRNLENGLVTTYNDNDEIYNQSEHYTLKSEYTGNPIYEVKRKKKSNIDFTQTITDKQ